MGPGATAAPCKDLLKVNGAVEAQRTVVVNVDPVALVIGGSVDDGYISTLHKVASDEQVLLIGRDLDVVGTDDRLLLIRVIKTLDVVEVGNVESSDMVAESDGEISDLAVIGDIGIDG